MLLIAVGGLVVGLAVPAAAHEARHLINGSSIKPHSITGERLVNNTLTGKQIEESRLGTVPQATNAGHLGGVAAKGYQHQIMWAYYHIQVATIAQQSGGIALVSESVGAGLYYFTFPHSIANDAIFVSPHYDVGSGNTHGEFSAAPCGASEGTQTSSGAVFCAGPNSDNELFVYATDGTGAENFEGFYMQAVGP